MKMHLLIGSVVDDLEFHKEVIFDSYNPQASHNELGGRWWGHQIYLNPQLLRVGAITTHDLIRYEVKKIEGNLFQIGKTYRQNRGINGQKDYPIQVVGIAPDPNDVIYVIIWPPHFNDIHQMSQQDLLRFLTEPVRLADPIR